MLGTNIIVLLSGLQGVPEEIYEAARVDGARGARMFTRITVPMVSPSLFFLLVVDTVAVLQAFTQIHLLTRGGPVDATRTLVYSTYLDAFQNFQFGFASAESVVLFVLIMALTIIQFRFVERLVHYQGARAGGRPQSPGRTSELHPRSGPKRARRGEREWRGGLARRGE